MLPKRPAVEVPLVLLPWIEPIQQEIRRMVTAQRDVEFLRRRGFECHRRSRLVPQNYRSLEEFNTFHATELEGDGRGRR